MSEERNKYNLSAAVRTAGGIAIAGVIWTPQKKTTNKFTAGANVLRAIPLSDHGKHISGALQIAGGVAISGISWNPERKPKEAHKFKAVATAIGLVGPPNTRSKYSIANALETAAGLALAGVSWTRHPKAVTQEMASSDTPLPKILVAAHHITRHSRKPPSRAASRASVGSVKYDTPSLVGSSTPLPQTPSLASVGGTPEAYTPADLIISLESVNITRTTSPSVGGSPEVQTLPIVHISRDAPRRCSSAISIPAYEARAPSYERPTTSVDVTYTKSLPEEEQNEIKPQSTPVRTPSPKIGKAAVVAAVARRKSTPKSVSDKPTGEGMQLSRSPSPVVAPLFAMAAIVNRNPTPTNTALDKSEEKQSPSPQPAPAVAAAVLPTPTLSSPKPAPSAAEPDPVPEVAPTVTAVPLASNNKAPNKNNKKSLANLSKAEMLVKKKQPGRALRTIKHSINKFR